MSVRRSVVERIRNGTYNDGDCQAYLVGKRDSAVGFAREVGDFIAHPKRNRGTTYDLATRIISQCAFFYFFRSDNPINKPFLGSIGPCPWWFKPWLISQLDMFSDHDMNSTLGYSRKQLKKKVKSWFDDPNDKYPEWVQCVDESFFFRVVTKLSTLLGGKAVFSIEEAWQSIKNLFESDGINSSIEDFMVCIAVVLSKTEVELPKEARGAVDLSVTPYCCWPAEPKQKENLGRKMFFTSPFGTLQAVVTVTSHELPFSIGTVLIDFEIDTRSYFDNNTSKVDEHGRVVFDTTKELAFDARRIPQVHSI